MPGQYVPRFRYGYSDQHLRVSDAERQEVADRLAAHYADGRLDQAEFEDRSGLAMNAKTRGDLAGLFDDLPEPGAAGASRAPARRAGNGRNTPLLFLALVVVITIVAAQAVVRSYIPWLWVGVAGAVIVLASGALNRRRPNGE
jgi:Domain of unknown function (DUF1707)